MTSSSYVRDTINIALITSKLSLIIYKDMRTCSLSGKGKETIMEASYQKIYSLFCNVLHVSFYFTDFLLI